MRKTEAEEIKELIDAAFNRVKAVKLDFAAFIADKTVPLAQRWELFKNADDCFSEHAFSIEPFESLKVVYGTDKYRHTFQQYFLYEDTDRREIISVLEAVERMMDLLDEPEEYDKGEEIISAGFSRTTVCDFKEELLKKNLKTIKVDW